jgi:hypothetical protein
MQPADDQRRGGEAELVGAEQRGDDHVAAGAHAAVNLHRDAPAQPVQHQGLVGLGQADLPGGAGVLDRRQRAGAGAAVVAGDGDVIGMGLGDAGGDGADADLGDQLHRDARPGVGVLQVVDQLGQVFDGVDVVVRRRRDQADARRGVAHPRDLGVDLVAGQLTALAGLGALGDLDLDVVGVDQVFTVTPKRPEATCLMAERSGFMEPSGSGIEALGSSPPSPVLDLPPMAFIALASVECAS